MAAQVPAKQPGLAEASMNVPMAVQPVPAPMELPNPGQGPQMDLKALLEDHLVEHPLESAFHG